MPHRKTASPAGTPDAGTIVGKTNLTNLKLHSPSIILDKFETDPNKRYKAVGCISQGVDEAKLQRLKDKFELVDWYRRRHTTAYIIKPILPMA